MDTASINQPEDLISIFQSYPYVFWMDGWQSNQSYPGFISKIFASSKQASFPTFGKRQWQVGFFSYHYKSIISHDFATQENYHPWFPAVGFIVPEKIANVQLEAHSTIRLQKAPNLKLISKTNFSNYKHGVLSIKERIQRGDLYETNYCVHWECNTDDFDPIKTFFYYRVKAQAPFSALVKWNNVWCLCFSPERFLKRESNTIMTQPIKGSTAQFSEAVNDQVAKKTLALSEKDRAENIMVVDLVRNDLTPISKDGSVCVSELCGLYSFRGIHHLVSTVKSELLSNISFDSVIKAMFPMGSMTGAPKINAIQIAAHHETHPRDLFSGSIGYITPEDDFDFNVVIRSLFYNAEKQLVQTKAGSGITIYSEADAEWQECLLKIKRWL